METKQIHKHCVVCKQDGPDVKKCVCGYEFCEACAKEELHDYKTIHCDKCNRDICTSYFSRYILNDTQPISKEEKICYNCEIRGRMAEIQRALNGETQTNDHLQNIVDKYLTNE